MNLTSINTPKMITYIKEVWKDDRAAIVLPRVPGKKELVKKWSKVEDKDIQIVKHQYHPDPIKPVAEEWEVIVHDVFKFGVVKNQNHKDGEFYMEQLKYK